jgi:hypothetical protein
MGPRSDNRGYGRFGTASRQRHETDTFDSPAEKDADGGDTT